MNLATEVLLKNASLSPTLYPFVSKNILIEFAKGGGKGADWSTEKLEMKSIDIDTYMILPSLSGSIVLYDIYLYRALVRVFLPRKYLGFPRGGAFQSLYLVAWRWNI